MEKLKPKKVVPPGHRETVNEECARTGLSRATVKRRRRAAKGAR